MPTRALVTTGKCDFSLLRAPVLAGLLGAGEAESQGKEGGILTFQ